MSYILDLIFPKTCYGCGKIGHYFCQNCLDQQKSSHIKLPNKNFDGCLSLFKYQSIIEKALIDLKYNFITDICDELSQICSVRIKNSFPNLLSYWHQNNYTLIPIPLHHFRSNWRGFNQSVLLGQKIAHLLDINYSENILFRHINTPPQAKFKDKKQRIFNTSNAFTINSDQPIPENIILFDDVSTTYSTLKSALTAFNKTSHPWALTLAG